MWRLSLLAFALASAASAQSDDGLDSYYVGGHMDNDGNRLTAQLIADELADQTSVSGGN